MTPTYRAVRAVVRLIFWGALLALIGWLISLTVDDRPSCPIRIVSPSQWEWTDTPTDLSECVAPEYMVLHPDFTWEWIQDK